MHLESLMRMQEQLIGMTVRLADADLIMVMALSPSHIAH